jgi:transcriptional regulator with XRE-family HTH domain
MGFRENLKEQLRYADMYVKELAALSGVKEQTIASYLSVRSRIPSAEAAVKIARVLGVSVEYLITGCQTPPPALIPLNAEIRFLMQKIECLNDDHRKIVLKNAINLSEVLREHEEQKV